MKDKIKRDEIKGITIDSLLNGEKLTKKFKIPIENIKAKNIDLPCKCAATDCWRIEHDAKKDIENGTKIQRYFLLFFEIL